MHRRQLLERYRVDYQDVGIGLACGILQDVGLLAQIACRGDLFVGHLQILVLDMIGALPDLVHKVDCSQVTSCLLIFFKPVHSYDEYRLRSNRELGNIPCKYFVGRKTCDASARETWVEFWLPGSKG